MSASLPTGIVRPHLDWYRKLAKKQLRALHERDPSSRLADAQLEVARSTGYTSWRALKQEIDRFAGTRQKELAALFERFASEECAGSSPLYGLLSRRIARDDALLAIASLGKTPIPNLFLAAVHYLVLRSPGTELARHYPSVNPNAMPTAMAFDAFRTFCLEHRSEIVGLMRQRIVQTNEVARCAYLVPAFRVASRLARAKALTLIEVGASAGLNLGFDRYVYDYGDGVVRGDATSPVRIEVELRGPTRPPLEERLNVRRHVGIDLNPVRVQSADDVAWLDALIWPEHQERRRRLRDALKLVESSDIELLSGDANDHLERLIRSTHLDVLPVVFQTHALNQFSETARKRFEQILDHAGEQRELIYISRSNRLTLDYIAPGKRQHILLADTDGHGRWIEWKHADAPAEGERPVDDALVDQFLVRVRAGDLDDVRKQLDASPGLMDRNGKHPQWGGRPRALHLAIETGNQAMFDLLLSRGADPAGDNAPYSGWSPLMLAIHWKRDAMRSELLGRVTPSVVERLMMGDDTVPLAKASESIPNDGSLLHFARTRRSAERLLEQGVPIDAKDKFGKTALDVAAESGAGDVVDVLVSRGAGARPATFARLGDLARVRKALGKAKPDRAVLIAAINGKHVPVVKWLISRGADVNAPDAQAITPLHDAAFVGSVEIVKLLVRAGANVHAEDDQYHATPAGWAHHAAEFMARTECTDVIAYLETQMGKKQPAPPAQRNTRTGEWKPIMDAAFAGDAKKIAKLIDAGADPNIASLTPGGHRPLHRAIEEKKTNPRTAKHDDAVRMLLERGADAKLRGSWDKHTALELAAISSPRFVPILVEHLRPLDIFHACCVLDDKRVAALLKQDRFLATAREVNGFTPLHYLAASRVDRRAAQLAIAQKLIDAGADVNGQYNYQNGQWPISVLYFACGFNDNPELTELLLKAGAVPYDNESIYHAADEGHDACLAVIEKYADRKKLAKEATMALRTQMHWGKSRGAKWLLEHGADPNSPYPQTGNSPLHYAARHGANAKVIDLLLKHGADPSLKNKEGLTAIEIAKKAKKPRVVAQLRKR